MKRHLRAAPTLPFPELLSNFRVWFRHRHQQTKKSASDKKQPGVEQAVEKSDLPILGLTGNR